jgi:tetratricopeptide (TPR) repeat protein
MEYDVSQKREPYEQALRSARAFADREQWRQAFAAYRDARALLPREAESYAGLGEACFALGRLDRALESYTLAARYSRGDMRYLERVADLQERLGLLTEAARTYMAVGELKLRQRRLDEAIYSWQRAVRLEPGLLGAHRRLAMVFQRQGNIIAAVREYLAIARALQMRGESDKALEMCRAALRLDPDNEDVRVAMHLVTHGEKALAEEPESEPATNCRRLCPGARSVAARTAASPAR